MNTFGRLLEARISKHGLNPNRLARILNEDPALIHKVIKGKRAPSARILEKIQEVEELELDEKTLTAWKALQDRSETVEHFFENPTNLIAFIDVFHIIKAGIGQEPSLEEMSNILGVAPLEIEPLYTEYKVALAAGRFQELAENNGTLDISSLMELIRGLETEVVVQLLTLTVPKDILLKALKIVDKVESEKENKNITKKRAT